MRQVLSVVIASVGLLLLAISIPAQGASGRAVSATDTLAKPSPQALRAVDIIRVINTAEVGTCRDQNATNDSTRFMPWAQLVNAPCFKKAQSYLSGSHFAQSGRLSFSAGPEIVPGLVLRLVVSPDGKHYNLSLGEKPSVQCGFTFFSDERGVIYEGRALGCNAKGTPGSQ
jgi:hypothetical protein